MGVETVILGGAALLGAAGSVMKGKSAKNAANAEASSVVDDAKLKAAQIRKLAGETRSQATAAYAASGVDVNQGTPLITEREITRRSEEDALFTVLGAGRQAKVIRAGGRAAATASYLDAGSTLLGGAADVYRAGGWKRAAGGGGVT